MRELKKVVLLNNEIINVGEMEEIPEGATVEEREMIYTLEYGWREVNWSPSLTLEGKLVEKEEQIAKLKEEYFKTQKMAIENSITQQELLELLMDMGVI